MLTVLTVGLSGLVLFGMAALGCIPLLSQTVLLKGVNDDADVLAMVLRGLVAARVKPYYLHHPDLAPGTGEDPDCSLSRMIPGRPRWPVCGCPFFPRLSCASDKATTPTASRPAGHSFSEG